MNDKDDFQKPIMYEITVIKGTVHDSCLDSFETYVPIFPHIGMFVVDDDGNVYEVERVLTHGFSNPNEAKGTPLATVEVNPLDENIA